MVLVIKIRDNIRVSQEANISGRMIFGDEYFPQQERIKDIFNLIDDETPFNDFLQKILDTFSTTIAYNSYWLARSTAMANVLISEDRSITSSYTPSTVGESVNNILSKNYFNYFSFEIIDYPTNKQFKILEKLKNDGLIEFYWTESKALPVPPREVPTDTSQTNNDLTNYLNFGDLESRGAGVKIIPFEVEATNNTSILREAAYLKNFLPNIDFTPSIKTAPNDGSFRHQKQTLITLFGSSPEGRITGIVPSAELVVCSVKRLESNDFLGTVRNLLIEIRYNEIKNAVLFFELELELEVINSKTKAKETFIYPVNIYEDIAEHLKIMSQHKTDEDKKNIVLVGSGNTGIDFDNVKNPPWKSKKSKYIDLTANNSSIIMVGATQKKEGKFIVEPETNFGKNLDVYMYTNFQVGNTTDNFVDNMIENKVFGGTSAATAVAAGIVTYLQGEARKIGGNLTPTTIKKVFQKSFSKNIKYHKRAKLPPTNVLTPTTLANLWIACQQVMREEAQQQPFRI